MDGHVIDALRGLLFDDFKHYLCVQIFDAFHARNGLVDWNRADWNWRMSENGLTNFVNVATGGKVHYRVGAIVHSCVKLFEFFVDFRGDGGVADVGIDLAQRGHADGHRFKLRMVNVRGNDHASASHFVAHKLGRQPLAVGNVARSEEHTSELQSP